MSDHPAAVQSVDRHRAGGRRVTWLRRAGTALGVVVLASGVTVAMLVAPLPTVLGLGAAALFVAVMARPAIAAYVLVASTPLIVGIDRSALVPVLRPNEALLVVLGAALFVRGLVRNSSGERIHFRLSSLDVALVVLCLTSSALPLLWEAMRGKAISGDDFLYSLTLWKYYAEFVVVRASLRGERHVRVCLWLSMAAASLVALVAVLQSLQLFGIPHLLASWYAPFGTTTGLDINRGTSTLASAIATGDVMAFNLGIALAMLARSRRHRPLLLGLSVLFAFGGIASGEFSAIIALVAVVATIGLLTRTLTRKLAAMGGVGALAALALQPVIARRLHDFSGGIPAGWADRLANLRQFFWPTLFSHFNYVLGVRPSPRVATPLFQTGFVWIESGQTWLLWTGGIPMFVAFYVFVWVALRCSLAASRHRDGAIEVAALATFAAVVAMTVLMTFDPHLTLRGSADLLFSLLALQAVRGGDRGDEPDQEDLTAASGQSLSGPLADRGGVMPVGGR
ncbi:MAG: hypothetical protein ACRDZ8_14735 [Acidimicrobiales bacterium]